MEERGGRDKEFEPHLQLLTCRPADPTFFGQLPRIHTGLLAILMCAPSLKLLL